MGFAGISPWSLLLILAIAVVIFGTKRLRNVGKDLGSAVKGFKAGLHGDEDQTPPRAANDDKNQDQ